MTAPVKLLSANKDSESPETRSLDAARALITHLRGKLQEGQLALNTAYHASGNAAAMLRGRTALVDNVLREIWRHFSLPGSLALVAVGGYGRGMLYPYSDVDILLLLPDGIDGKHDGSIEQTIGLLWDIGLDVGHSVRRIAECIEEAERDITVQTSLLEARLLAGSRKTFSAFSATLRAHLNPQAFFKAKLLEHEERYARHNDTPYSLEPNCKESPGGLRDLQVILWISRAAGLGGSWRELARNELITQSEARQLERLEAFLCHVRIRLHLLAKRREDKLMFDHQEALAKAFEIQRSEAKRASELLMQRYYRNAKHVTQLNTILLQNLAERLSPASFRAPIVISEHFQTDHDMLDVRNEDIFELHPRAILESFLILQQRSELKGMTARTLRALWRARGRINAKFRRDPANRASFISLFQQKRGLVHEFRRMNQYDILGHYLPAFGKIVGQMQHDLFHVYTVDQHILQVMRNVRRYTMLEFTHEYPLCSRLIAGFERHWLLYVAALFHDIAKGRGGDHSKLGMADAKRFCGEHGISAEDTDLVVFLVEHHLTLSSIAQKQDLADLDVIRNFAALVKTERRLIGLYLLTVADIRGTSPKVWNAWKGKLLEDLYAATRRLLSGATPHQALGLAGRQEEARGILRFNGLRPGIEEAFWEQLDTAYFMRHDAEEIAWHTRILYHRPDAAEPVVKARINHVGEGLQVMVYVVDQPELFARLCGFFSRLCFSIADAKIHTTRHGYALDSFILLDPSHQLPYRDMTALLEHDLVEQLKTRPPLAAPATGRLSRQVKHFPITPEVSIRPDEKGQYHVMSIGAADRPGLLHSIALVLSRHGVDLHTAKIATLGERVEDTFLISGKELTKTATLVKLEQELLDAMQV